MSERPVLVVIETQKVKDFLFASPMLRETRGASYLLDRLNRQVTKGLVEATGGEAIYLGGGSGRVLFERWEAAEEFRRKLLAQYRQETWNARVSVEILRRREGESLPAWMARGVHESRKNKLARLDAVPMLGGRWLRPCTSCGKEPAQEEPPEDVQGVHLLCPACSQKRRAVRRFYRKTKSGRQEMSALPGVERLREEVPGSVLETLAESLHDEPGEWTAEPLLPWDFDAIGSVSRPHGYMGLIYADGNQMGKVLQEMGRRFLEDPEARQAYRGFSEIADRSTREAAVEAVLSEVPVRYKTDPASGKPRPFLAAEFLLAGGDDLILAVPADAALRVAVRFTELFQEKSRELQRQWQNQGDLAAPFAEDGLVCSAGVVLAHASYPAAQSLDAASDLMKMAKRKAARASLEGTEAGGVGRSEATLDFAVLHASGTEPLLERRRREYVDAQSLGGGREIRRTERPYTASELRTLLERVRELRAERVPRGKLKSLYEALFQSPLLAQMESMEIKERLQATGALSKRPLGELVEQLNVFPFREDGDHWSSPLSEIVELYDFVREDEAVHETRGGDDAD